MKNKIFKKLIIYVLLAILLIGVIVGGYFLFKYLFPSDKELFVIAHANTIEQSSQKTEPERFTNTTDVSLKAEGGFNSKDAVKAFESLHLKLDNTKYEENKTTYDVALTLGNKEMLTSSAVKSGDTEVFTIPQLVDKKYASNTFGDVLSLLLGSENAEDVDIMQDVDKVKLTEYLKKYLKDVYNNVPDSSFTSEKDGDIKIITLDADINRTLYDTVMAIKNDTELRDFLYAESSKVCENINKKFPYAGELTSMPEKEEYDKNYEESLDKYIKDIENSRIVAKIKVNKDRVIIQEDIKVASGDMVQQLLSFSDKHFCLEAYEGDNILIKYNQISEKAETITEKTTNVTFDVNDMTKEKSETEQKLIILTFNSVTDTNVSSEFVMADNYEDIRNMSDEDKKKITESASGNFVSLVATLTLELLK